MHWLAWGESRRASAASALRKPLKLAAGASARDLAKALKPGNILGQASLVGTYGRPIGS